MFPELTMLQAECYEIAGSKGFHDLGLTFPERIALIHSEVSEALEEYRDGHPLDETRYLSGKPEGVPIEIADVIIRCLDLAEEYKFDVGEAIGVKMAYNRRRQHLHGKLI